METTGRQQANCFPEFFALQQLKPQDEVTKPLDYKQTGLYDANSLHWAKGFNCKYMSCVDENLTVDLMLSVREVFRL